MAPLRLLLLLAGLAAASCAADGAPLPAWRQKLLPDPALVSGVAQELSFNNGAEPQTLDPAIMTGVLESRLALALYEGLTSYDPQTLETRPGAAQSWEITPDQLDYTFHLRPGATFSDGEAVTAEVFRASWLRVLDPAIGASYAYQLFPVAGAEDYHTGKSRDPSTVQVTSIDPMTLHVHLARPCPYFLDLCAFPTLNPVPLAKVAAFKEQWTQPANFAGNGPYVLTAWTPRSSIVMEPNPRYWDRSHITLTRITALPYTDAETAYKQYQGGSLDWSPGVPPSKMDEVLRLPDYYVAPYLGVYFYRFNCAKPPFDDKRVRIAFSLAIDRKLITEHVTKGGELPASWFCPDCAGYHHVDGLPYDPQRARALLAEAGYGPGGKPFPATELLTNDTTIHRAIADSVMQQWHDVLGVVVSPSFREWKVYLDAVEHQDYQIARSSWIGDYGDPNTFFDMWVTDGGNNHTGWSSADYDRLLHASQSEPDHAKRLALFGQLEHLLVVEEEPVVPIYIYVTQRLLRENVQGWFENVRDIHPFQYLWKRR